MAKKKKKGVFFCLKNEPILGSAAAPDNVKPIANSGESAAKTEIAGKTEAAASQVKENVITAAEISPSDDNVSTGTVSHTTAESDTNVVGTDENANNLSEATPQVLTGISIVFLTFFSNV